jgi:iron complex outermembrane receptor protein
MTLRRLLKGMVLPVMLLIGLVATAQETILVSGKVSDSKDGSPLIGVSVTVKGTPQGTATDANGNFSLRAARGATLVFTYVGFATKEMTATGTEMTVFLEGAKTALNEVVVIGYGRARKKDLTGAVTMVTSKDFQTGNIPSPEQLIAGKVAGVQIVSGGAPGAGSAIRIRGESSFGNGGASNDPLIVIDGVPVASSGISGSPNALSMINPNDIESFNVLKDASATAIYGNRASGGVIIITTKKGKRGKPQFNFSTNLALQTPSNTVDVLSTQEFRDFVNQYGNASQKGRLGNSSTDWQNEIYQNALASDNILSVSGAAGKMPYRASLGYTYQDGILKTDNMKRLTGSLSLSPKFFNNYLSVDVNLKATQSKFQFANQGAIGSAVGFDPTQSVLSGKTEYGGYFEWLDPSTGKPNPLAPRNPVSLLKMRDDNSDVFRSIGNVQLDYKFHFLPDLRANLNLGYDISRGEGTVFIPETAGSQVANNRPGTNNKYKQDKDMKLMEFYLNYAKDLKSIKSKIDVMAGYSYQDFKTKDYFYPDFYADGTIRPGSTPNFAYNIPQYTLISFFGRAIYTYNDKYILTATYRRDGTSKFSPDTRWGDFPSFAAAWKIGEENFLKNSKTISDLKLRVGYGITGQQEGIYEYGYLPVYSLSNNSGMYQFGNTFYNMFRPGAYDANLKWEEQSQLNIGVDFGFWNNRLNGSIDYFDKESYDLLATVPIPAGSNFSNQLLTNVGSIRSKGVEFTVNAVPVKKEKLVWNVGFNITYNDVKVTKLSKVEDPNAKGIPTGGIAGGTGNTIQIQSVGYRPRSFFVYQQIYDKDSKPIEGLYEDRNRDGIINEDDLYRYKASNPEVYMGFSTDVTYGKFTAGLVARANFGNYVYNNVASNRGVARAILDPANFLSNGFRDVLFTNFQNNQYFSDYYVKNASFLRMDNIFFGYNFGDVLAKKTNLRASFNIQNAFVITNYDGLDPEVFGGIDNNFYPRPRTFTLGLQFGF